MTEYEYTISKTWDGDSPPEEVEKSEIKIKLSSDKNRDIVIEIDAPFHNNPQVPSEFPIGSTPHLWNYEVVELFFLGDDNKYLEIELSPKGHYLLLQLDGSRNVTKEGLLLENFTTKVNEEDHRWKGRAFIPLSYFPDNVQSFNAYGIYKSPTQTQPEDRIYMSLFPVEKNKFQSPDFHRLNYFKAIAFEKLIGS